ncbi:ComEC/Rec2 family competence protein [Maribellus maritimus]|uniref:ComEC/Rec2 family competence protein n=1 Tax=Maribellus maritimus TaxID=2870838 RepID=UPI001EEC34B8|nr:ComEC/Rec2 family competence protein [Maribellus maritimus]MCG6187025.1 ComEC family competence protein [Maribellus maritimus]
MDQTVQKIPFLRLTIALALGIIICAQAAIPALLILPLVITVLFLLIFLHKNYSFNRRTLFGVLVHFLFFSVGVLTFHLYNKKPTFYKEGKFLATVFETPQERENSYKSALLIRAFSSSGDNKYTKTKEKIIVYFEPDKRMSSLSPGDQIIFSQSPQIIQNNGNPFEFDYKSYLARKKIYRQIYLPSDEWTKTDLKPKLSLIILAEKTRDKLLKKYREQNIGENEFEILSALTLGYKRELDPEIKRVFSSAGAMHVLAVSGLHVGIIYWVLITSLGFIKRKKTGRLLFALLAIFCLWTYAFVTGLSPSVLRATTMFSFFVIGDSIKRKGNIYNSLAASALFLLLINPNNLFEVGFQLSFSAVFGIVYLQPKISGLLPIKYKLPNYFWTLLTVSVAAQIATFPISTFYFNQFPSYFFISNLFVIPAVFVLIPLGILLLVFSSVPILSNSISFAINWVLNNIYFLLKEIENLPFAVQKISFTTPELIFVVTILVSFLLILKTPRTLYIKITLISILLLVCNSLIQKIQSRNTNQLIVYNSAENLILQLISGKSNYVISDNEIHNEDYEKTFIENTTVKMNLNPARYLNPNKTFKNEELFIKNGLIFFKGKIIAENENANKLPPNIIADFVINPVYFTKEKQNHINKSSIIITNKRFIPKSNPFSNQIFNVTKQGAYQKKW